MLASPVRIRRCPGLFFRLVLAAALAATPVAADETRGRTAEDIALEDFLLTADIVEIEDVGEGITKPKRVTLVKDGVTHRAIYKNVDVELDGIVKADRVERDFSDKYVYEIAAYRVDRLAGIGMVPVTVLRVVDGEPGSLQLWIEDVTTLEKALADPTAEVENFDLLVERLTVMYVLDALIMNVDRNHGNVLVNLEADVFHPIDHSRAFRLSPKPPPASGNSDIPIPERVAEGLEDLDLAELQEVLGDLLEPGQIRAIIKRRDRLVKQLDKRGLLPR
ncbi:MAG: hypothetical protein V3T72_01895 [Thermoanaerobaculia bacterium]